ncbi:DUF4446 family protein [Fodinisporobacter ferrooxydans]|uniref:DUF4446 family protein n=1 Tax=Fodinisporobacter ferrooxydans TaxID=2901836 RepID=A0ABY4CP25_9BACL|nr:DUF4446 family protein [Alicyclobacillaceae bacterium MYW30-H2]
MISLHSLILDNIEVITLTVLGLLILIFILLLMFLIRFAQLRKQYQRIMTVKKKLDLEQLLFQYVEDVQKSMHEQKQLSISIESLEQRITNKLGTIGVIRFNAFGNTGSDLSYAVALLNSKGDGVVLSSIYGREESRTYAKPVTQGSSTYPLTEEEKLAIQKALQTNES